MARLFLDERNLRQAGVSEQNIRTWRVLTEFANAQEDIATAQTDIEAAEASITGKADKTIDLTAGAGLTGGGTLAANRTFAVGAGTGITVNADDVAIDTSAEAERIRDVIGTALVAGSNMTITVDDGADTITLASSGGGGATESLVTITPTSTVSHSTNSFAAKSTIWTTYEDLDVGGLYIYVHTAGTYIAQLTALDGSNVVTADLGTSSSVVRAADRLHVFKFASRVSVPSGTRLALSLIRTDGATNAACNASFAAVTASAVTLTYVISATALKNVAFSVGNSIDTGGSTFATHTITASFLAAIGGVP